MQGGDFNEGMKMAMITSIARAVYVGAVEYDVDGKAGGEALPKTYGSKPNEFHNNIGTAGNADFPDHKFSNADKWHGEGSIGSKALNQIPGVNAVAGLHDVFQISVSDGLRENIVYNVGGMFVAAGVTYTALMNGQTGIALTIQNRNVSRGCNFSGVRCP